MKGQLNAEEKYEAQVRQVWDSVEEEITAEAMEQQAREVGQYARTAREMERAAVNVDAFARQMQMKIARTGLDRVWQLRCAGKFNQADEALRLMQEYLRAVHATRLQAADSGLSQEEIFAHMEYLMRAHELTQPEVQPMLWPAL